MKGESVLIGGDESDRSMLVTFRARGPELQEKLRDRLAIVERLRCEVHGGQILAVSITAFENGWFDTNWMGCCEALTNKAATIVGRRF